MLAVEEIWRTEGIELEVLGNGAFRVTARRLHAPRGGMTLSNDPPCEIIRARRCARLCA